MQLRGNIDTLEEQLQKTKEFFVETNMTNVQAIKEEQEVKEKEFEEKENRTSGKWYACWPGSKCLQTLK